MSPNTLRFLLAIIQAIAWYLNGMKNTPRKRR